MMRLGIILTFLSVGTLFGAGAMAQTVSIRSGEHESFTRLVMLLPDKASWAIKNADQSAILSIDLPTLQFDTSQVFSRIPRTRLVALAQNTPGDDLIFTLGCDCSVSSFVEASGYLVIDIKDGRPKAPAVPIARRTGFDVPAGQTPYRFATARPASAPQETGESAEIAGTQGAVLPVVTNPTPVVPRAKPSPLPGAAGSPPGAVADNAAVKRPNGLLNISEERLLAQISRASDQGLLHLKPVPESTGRTGVVPGAAVPAETGVPRDQPDRQLPVVLSVTSVVDRDLALIAGSIDQTGEVQQCLKSDRVAVHDWGGARPFDAEIGHWRARLFGERDHVDRDNAFALARAYLHFGFGAEASQVVDLSQSVSNDAMVLRAMARILDADGPVGDKVFEGQQHCDGDVALWAVLARYDVDPDVNGNAVQQAFLRLPVHLRGYLGPKLSQIFTDADDGSMAKFILRAMARTDIETGTGVELAKAAVAQLHGDSDAEERALVQSLETGSEHSPEALVRLIANLFAARDAVAPDLHELAAAYALEYRKTEKGPELRRASAVALALAGQFDRAFSALADIEKRDGLESRQMAMHPLLALLAERADDITFARLAMVSARLSAQNVPADIGNKIARRLLDLGFSELAALWVEDGENPVSDARRFIRAEIALKRRLPSRAMVELLGLNGPKAATLRAQAMWQEGDYQQAGQILAGAKQYDQAARGFWMAENWEDVPQQADARYARIVAGSVGLRDSDAGAEQLAPLANAQALMQNSSVARSDIAELLQSASVEADLSE